MTQILATPQESTAAENRRQATAALVHAVDIARAGGVSHEECHAIVDSRPHR